jgi:serine/threonine protein kinase
MSWREAEAARIFLEAVEHHDCGRRADFVREVAAGDPLLLQRVDALLKAHGEPNHLLDGDRLVPAGDLPQPAEGPGTEIGPYKLLEQIGEGGMGLVFMAEQARPVRRKVALKVVKPGMDTRQVVARFEAERQALALMDHANIARVFDAGATASGRPYFVMELVRGVPITDFCDQRRLTTRGRLELFIPVCQAVQHAHHKGVIHRDLKPSNVLVTLHDTVAVPKVIDFGIAKATAGPLTERTLFTHFAQVVGTPLYMSPEQAEMSGLDVDTRSDVYSLGVLLYELLTGTTPFEARTLKKVGLDEMRRIIREEEPPAPSRRLSTLDARACATVSERRGVDGRRLGQTLRGELDWVVMRALEKNRTRRYESAGALAADVQRYLADEAVAACPPSAGYRVRKYVRRNRRALLTAGVLVVGLVGAAVVSAWQAVVARDAQHQAEADRDRAQTAELIAREVSNFLQDDLLRQAGSPPQEDGQPVGIPDLTVREALDRASAKVAERFGDRPLVEAAIRMAIGEAYRGLSECRLATKHLERALELRQAHLGPHHPETRRSMEWLAEAYTWVGRKSDSIVLHELLLEDARARLAPDDPKLLDRVSSLAASYRRAGQWKKAMALLEQAIKVDETLRGPAVAGISPNADILAMLYQDAGKYEESVARFERILEHKKALGIDYGEDRYLLGHVAEAYQRAGRLEEAERIWRGLIVKCRQRTDSLGQIRLAGRLAYLCQNLQLQGRCAEAEELAREALTLYDRNPHTEGEWRRPHVMSLLGGALLGQKKYADAEPLLLKGYAGVKQAEDIIVGQERYRLDEAGERVVRYYEETNQPGHAREWREKLQAATDRK